MKYFLVFLVFSGFYAEGLWYQEGGGPPDARETAIASGMLAGIAVGVSFGWLLGSGVGEEAVGAFSGVMPAAWFGGITGNLCYQAFKERTTKRRDMPKEKEKS